MCNVNLTVEKLTEWLVEAKKEHAQYEKQLGRFDEEWARWYAEYIIKKLPA